MIFINHQRKIKMTNLHMNSVHVVKQILIEKHIYQYLMGLEI